MAWFKVDDKLHSHPKRHRAGMSAMGMDNTTLSSLLTEQVSPALLGRLRAQSENIHDLGQTETPATCANRPGGVADAVGVDMPTLAQPTPTSLYLYYDSNDLLLYVGITSRGTSRNAEHNRTKEWWPFVARQNVEHYPSREAALKAEKGVIQYLHPPFNVQHNPDHAATREAYLTLRALGKLPKREHAHRRLNWLPLDFVSYDGSKFLYTTPSVYGSYVDALDRDRYGFLCALHKGKASVTREHGALWVSIRGNYGRIVAPRLRVHLAPGKSMTYTVRGIDLIGDGPGHPVVTKWSADNAARRGA